MINFEYYEKQIFYLLCQKNYFLTIMDDVAEGILEKKSVLSFFLVKYNSISVVFYGRFISNIFFKKTLRKKT